MALKGKAPEQVKPSKPHIMISGKPGVGKTLWALNFPSPYLIDVEGGATRDQYVKKLKESGGAYMGIGDGSQDYREVISQIRELATTKTPYKTVILDSASKLYNVERALAEERLGSNFGVDKREANRPTKQLLMWLKRCDLNVILIAHQKDKWSRRDRELIMEGSTFDFYDKTEYELDLWMEAVMVGAKRMANIVKSRIDAFPMNTQIDLDFPTFKKLYGAAVIDESTTQIVLASAEQVAEINHLVELLKVEPETIDKWLAKAQATEIEDLSKDNAEKLLKALKEKIEGKGGK